MLLNSSSNIILNVVGTTANLTWSPDPSMGSLYAVSIPTLLYSLLVLVQGIALSVRRLHDTNKCGWWLLLYLLPILGFIILIVFYVLPGTVGSNKYGDDLKTAAQPAPAAA